jgi:hypothetical protein
MRPQTRLSSTSQAGTLSRLRKFFAGELVINRLTTGYQMSIEHLDCDHVEFDQLSRKGTAALRDRLYAEAASLLRKALALWRGPPLCDATDRLIEIESPQLQEAQTNALEARIDADLAVGRHRQLTAELAGLVSTHLLRERFGAQLMTALYRCDLMALTGFQVSVNTSPASAIPPGRQPAAATPSAGSPTSPSSPATLPLTASRSAGQGRRSPWHAGRGRPHRGAHAAHRPP